MIDPRAERPQGVDEDQVIREVSDAPKAIFRNFADKLPVVLAAV